jgi:hypothetical protein
MADAGTNGCSTCDQTVDPSESHYNHNHNHNNSNRCTRVQEEITHNRRSNTEGNPHIRDMLVGWPPKPLPTYVSLHSFLHCFHTLLPAMNTRRCSTMRLPMVVALCCCMLAASVSSLGIKQSTRVVDTSSGPIQGSSTSHCIVLRMVVSL